MASNYVRQNSGLHTMELCKTSEPRHHTRLPCTCLFPRHTPCTGRASARVVLLPLVYLIPSWSSFSQPIGQGLPWAV